MKKSLLTFSVFTFFGFQLTAQIVNIPDPNFKAYLLAISSINTNMDTEIQVSEASAYNGSLSMNSLNITDLTGIEAFTDLTGILICYNPITSMDLSQNTNLTTLHCYINQLTSLDVSANTALTELRCERNLITGLDISNLTNLTVLTCGNNELSSIDVSNNPLLTQIDISNTWMTGGSNQITTLNTSNNPLLTSLGTDSNPITSFDFTNNVNLETLACDANDFTSLNVSMLPNLSYLSCSNNNITTLDVSNNMALTDLYLSNLPLIGGLDLSNHLDLKAISCDGSSISSLNIANGNNINFTNMWAIETTNLTCVQVDDAAWATTNWNAWNNIDATDSYSEDCSGNLGLSTTYASTMNLFPNPSSSVIKVESEANILSVSIFNMTGTLVQQETMNAFSISHLPNGMYLINVTTDKGISTERFIKE